MNKPTVFITGATGFLGSHLTCLLLKQGYKVVAMRRNPQSQGLFPSIHQFHQLPAAFQPTWVTGDILDIDDLTENIKNVLNKFQYGVYLSFGFNTWNPYIYYGLNPIFDKNKTAIENNVSAFNIGLKFYIL
jgi:UDP-glucose 4-epimerase